MAKQYLQIDSEQNTTEFSLIRAFAKLMGLKNTTALLLHIRQTLPETIKTLKELSVPSENTSPSVNGEVTQINSGCQGECQNG